MPSSPSAPHLVVISHRRSGTHLAIDTLAHHGAAYTLPYLNLDRLRRDHPRPLTLAQCEQALAQGPRILKSHMHADPAAFFHHDEAVVPFVQHVLRHAKRIYVCRDGRDVLTSLYFYMQLLRKEVARVPFDAFIRQPNNFESGTYSEDLNRVAYWSFHVQGWLAQAGVFPLTFEALRYTPAQTIPRLLAHVNQPVPTFLTPLTRTPIFKTNHLFLLRMFNKLTTHKLAQLYTRYVRRIEHSSRFFRHGTRGSYHKHFSAADLAYFDEWGGEALRAVLALDNTNHPSP